MINVLHANDKSGCYPDSFYTASVSPMDEQPVISGHLKADVGIIGAGFSGISAALHLKKLGYDVALIDAHRIGWGASGRNGGQVNSGQRVDQIKLTSMVGADHARELWNIAEESKRLIKSLISDFDIECELEHGIIHANHKPEYRRDSQEEVEFLNREYGYQDIRFIDRDEMRKILDTTAYYDGSLDAGAFHLHPLKFLLGLARQAKKLGVRIYERSEVQNIEYSETVRISTSQGQLDAKHLILAANGYLGRLDKKISNRVFPINNYIIATEPLDPDLAQMLISNRAAVADSKFVINYYRLSADNRLLFGGRESYRYRFPTDIKSFVRKAMLDIYPQLEGTKIDYGWGGTLGITMNRMPYFQRIGPSAISIGGYSGHGVSIATLGGKLAADAVAGTAEKFDVLSSVNVPPIPGGYHARLPLLALGMAYYSLRDRL